MDSTGMKDRGQGLINIERVLYHTVFSRQRIFVVALYPRVFSTENLLKQAKFKLDGLNTGRECDQRSMKTCT